MQLSPRWQTAVTAILGACLPVACFAQTSKAPPETEVKVAGNPFTAVPSGDGQWVFVSQTEPGWAGITILHREGMAWVRRRQFPIKEGVIGLALTRDSWTLLAAAGESILCLDVRKLISGAANPVIGRVDCKGTGAVCVAITPDDGYAFVSNENKGTLSVLKLSNERAQGSSRLSLVGTIKVGLAPVGLAVSPDGKLLFSTSEMAPADYKWPKLYSDRSNHRGAVKWSEGVLTVIDVHLAETDPAHSVVQKLPSGNSPVRVVASPDGDKEYVTVRGADFVYMFTTAALLTDPKSALLAKVPVGSAPVGLALSNDGLRLFVLNSNRFDAKSKTSSIWVIDTSKLGGGSGAVIGSIPAEVFPREARLSADGRTLFVTDWGSGLIQIIDVSGFLVPKG